MIAMAECWLSSASGFSVTELFQYLDAAEQCSGAVREQQAIALGRCAEIDALLVRASSLPPKTIPVAGLLKMSARGMFFASVRTALTGYRAALFPTLRASLEAACYAQEVEEHPELSDIWMSRHKSEEARKQCRKKFSDAVPHCCDRLGQRMPDNARLIRSVYDHMIDDGAHPNVRSIVPGLHFEDKEDVVELSLGFVVPEQVRNSLFCCYEIGLFTAWVMGNVEPMDHDFWIEASRLNDQKNDWEAEIQSDS